MKDAQPNPVAGGGGPPGQDVHPLFFLHHTALDVPATSWTLETLPLLELLKCHCQESYFLCLEGLLNLKEELEGIFWLLFLNARFSLLQWGKCPSFLEFFPVYTTLHRYLCTVFLHFP